MKRLICLTSFVLVSLVGLSGTGRAADPSGIPHQLEVIKQQLTAIKTDIAVVQTTVATISTWPKKYFLTNASFNPTVIFAAKACGPGFHFANMFELLDPSGLIYDAQNPLAFQDINFDQGSGPPTGVGGWIRTGSYRDAIVGTAGWANCDKWTKNTEEARGTQTFLRSAWFYIPEIYNESITFFPNTPWWYAYVEACSKESPVWCVSD